MFPFYTSQKYYKITGFLFSRGIEGGISQKCVKSSIRAKISHFIGTLSNQLKPNQISGKSGLVGEGVILRIERISAQTRLGALPGFGTQSCYKPPGDIGFKLVYAVIKIGFVRLLPRQRPVGRGVAKKKKKKSRFLYEWNTCLKWLNPSLPNVSFWPTWKGFLMFSGGSKRNMGKKRV